VTDISERTLSNGLRLIHAPLRSHPVISVQLYIRMGSCWEPEGQEGWSHFLEHLVFKSTERYPEGAITEAAVRLGGHLNAYTENDSTCFAVTLPACWFAEAMDMIAELGYRSNFSKKDFTSERRVVIEEIKEYRNDPEDWFLEQIPQLYFAYNPLRRPIAGDERSLMGATWEQAHAFYRTWYSPHNAFLVVCGDADPAVMEAEAERAFGAWSGPVPPPRAPRNEPWPTTGALHHLPRKLDNPLLAFTLPELADAHPDAHALSLLSQAFIGSRDSRLYDRLFHTERLIDGSKVHSLCGLHNGLAAVLLFPRRGVEPQRVFDVVREEMDAYRRGGIKSGEIERQKTEMLYGHRYTFEYTESLAFSLGGEEVSGDWRAFLRFPELARAIDGPQLERLLQEHFDPDASHLFHLGPKAPNFQWQPLERKAAYGAGARRNGEYMEAVLANGMRVALKHVPDRPVTGVALAMPVSQLNEAQHERGINHLALTMLLYGTSKRNHHQLMADSARHGITMNVAPRLECSLLRAKCFDLDPALEIMAELLSSSTFPQEHLRTIRQTSAGLLDRIKDQPQQHAARLWKRMLFGADSQYVSRQGSKGSLAGLTRARVRRWSEQWYGPANRTLCIVGNIDFDRTLAKVERAFENTGTPGLPTAAEPLVQPCGNHYRVRRDGMDQSVIHFGGFAADATDPQRSAAMYVLAGILGGDLHARLYTALRERMGAAYSVGFDYRSTRRLGWYTAAAVVDRATEREAVAEIRRQLELCRTGDITPRELETAKNAIRGDRLLDEESVLHQAQALAMLLALGYTYDYYLAREQRLEAVTLPMLREEAERWFTPDNYYIHVYA